MKKIFFYLLINLFIFTSSSAETKKYILTCSDDGKPYSINLFKIAPGKWKVESPIKKGEPVYNVYGNLKDGIGKDHTYLTWVYAIGPSEDFSHLFENMLIFKDRKLHVYMRKLSKDEFNILKQKKIEMKPQVFDYTKFEIMQKDKSKVTYAGAFTECKGDIFETKY